MVASKFSDDVFGAFNELCRLFLGPAPRATLTSGGIGRTQAFKRMKRVVFEAVFVKERGRSRGGPSPINGVLLQYALSLRHSGRVADADRLERLAKRLLTGECADVDSDAVLSVVTFMLLLSQPPGIIPTQVVGFAGSLCSAHEESLVSSECRHGQLAAVSGTCSDIASFFVPQPLRSYPNYPRELFEEMYATVNDSKHPMEGLHCAAPYKNFPRSVFEQLPGVTPDDHSLLEVKGILDDTYDRVMSCTLFGALTRSCDGTRVPTLRLELPELTYRAAMKGISMPTARRFLQTLDGSLDQGLMPHLASDCHSSADEGFSEAERSPRSMASSCCGPFSADEAIYLESPLPDTVECPRYLTWENRKRSYNCNENPYLTEAHPDIFDAVYELYLKSLKMVDPSVVIPVAVRVPLSQLMQDSMNALISLPSTSYRLDESSNKLALRSGITISGLSCEATASACADFAVAGTRHRRLSVFCSPSAICRADVDSDAPHERGLVFLAFSAGVRSYLQWYREVIVGLLNQSSAVSVRTPMQLEFRLRKLFEQLKLLSELCQCEGEDGLGWKASDFPTGIRLLSVLHQTATDAVGKSTYTLSLMLLHTACKPYLKFISDWVFFGTLSDCNQEFVITMDETKVLCRDRRYWTEGFTLNETVGNDKFPLLKNLTKGIYVCGKSMHLLRLCNPDHFLCTAVEVEVPPVSFVYAHEEELNEVSRKSQAYVARVKQMAKHKLLSRTAVLEEREKAKHDLMATARTAAAQEVERLQKKISDLRKSEDARKRQAFREMKEQMEDDLKRRANVIANEKTEDTRYIQSLLEKEKAQTEREKELETRAREELIEEYARLTEAAARREQRALWRVRRRQRDSARHNFLLAEHDRLLREQAANSAASQGGATYGGDSSLSAKAPPQELSNSGADPGGPSGQRESASDALAGWREETSTGALDNLTPRADAVLLSTDGLLQENATEPGTASDGSRVATAGVMADSLLQAEISKGTAAASAGADPLASHTVEAPNHSVELAAVRHLSPESESVSTATQLGVHHHVSVETASLPFEKPRSSVAAVSGCHATAESDPVTAETRPIRATVEGRGISLESEGSEPARRCIAPVADRHVSQESQSTTATGESECRTSVAAVSGHRAGAESEPDAEPRLLRAAVEGCSISAESQNVEQDRRHVALVTGRHASRESAPVEQSVRSSVATVSGRHVSRESEPLLCELVGNEVTVTVRAARQLPSAPSAQPAPNAAAAVDDRCLAGGRPLPDVVDQPAATESSSRDQPGCTNARKTDLSSVATGTKADSTACSPDALPAPQAVGTGAARPCVAAVEGRHASFESGLQLQPADMPRPHVARVAGRHASVESQPPLPPLPPAAAKQIRPRAGLGTLSEVALEAYEISGPPLPLVALSSVGRHSSIDSTYQIRANRKKSRNTTEKWTHVSPADLQQQQQTDDTAGLALVELTAASDLQQHNPAPASSRAGVQASRRTARVNEESEYVDQQAIRVHKFKERNFKGHSSDSTVQKLLYGNGKVTVVAATTMSKAAESDCNLPGSGKAVDGTVDQYDDTSAMRAVEECLRSLPPRYDDHDVSFADAGNLTTDLMSRLFNQATQNQGVLCAHHGDECPGKPQCELMYEYTSLPVLLQKSLAEPLAAQISLVNSSLLSYFMIDLSIDRHFEALRRYLLMENGEYSQVMGDLLFEKLDASLYARDVLNPVFLNQVLAKALQSSVEKPDAYAGNLAFALRTVPTVLLSNAPDAFSCLDLKYKVDWPLNIILSDSVLAKYSQVFSFMLQLRRIVYALKETWVLLKRAAIVHGAAGCTQLLQLQLFRHEMQHFVKVMQGYVANQVIDVAWREFQDGLQHHVHSLEELYERHAAYVNHCLIRCLLNKKASAISKVINTMFGLILKLRGQLKSATWQTDPVSGNLQHPAFESMAESYSSFRQYSEFLFKVISKLAVRGYQPQHLEELLLRINFNDYYEN